MKRLVSSVSLLLCVILLLTACTGKVTSATPTSTSSSTTISTTAKTRDTLTVAFRNEAANLDPHNNGSLTAFAIEKVIYDRLVDKDEQGNLIPMLAKSWKVIDDTTVRFFLRDDVYFHNGEKLTAEDVRYTIERAEIMSGSKAYMSSFDGKGTKVVDDYTIDIKLHNSFAPIYNYLSSARGNIVCKKAVEQMGVEARNRNPVGSGPLKFVSWVSGNNITLERNDKYWGKKPNFKKLVCRFISEPTNRAIEVESGGVDIALHVDAGDVERLSNNKNTKVIVDTGFSYTYISFNTLDFEVFKDVRVRRALAMATDLTSIVKIIWRNYAKVADCDLPSTFLGYSPQPVRKYDQVAAKALLIEAGFDFSKPIVFSVSDDATIRNLAEMCQSMWGQIGVKVEIATMEQATLTQKGLKGEIMMYAGTESAASGDPDNALYYYQAGTTGRSHNDSKINELLAKGKQTYDLNGRKAVYSELCSYLWNYVGRIEVAYNSVIYATSASIDHFYADPGYVPNFADVTFK